MSQTKLDAFIDRQHVFNTYAGNYTFGVRRHKFDLEDREIELIWKMNYLRGGIDYIVLSSGATMLASYGRKVAPEKLGLTGADAMRSAEILRVKVGDDTVDSNDLAEIDREEFPLDNTSGSNMLTVQQEITRSLTSSIEVDKGAELNARLGAKLLSMIDAEIGGKLSANVSETIGQTTSRRQQLEFQVKPGDYVVYTVIWKKRVRKGRYRVTVNGVPHDMPYQASFGLSFEVNSRVGKRDTAVPPQALAPGEPPAQR
jgi:hypothetical protein